MPEKRLLVIGGGGFIGRSVVATAAHDGWRVLGVGRRARAEPGPAGCEFAACDAADLAALRAIFQDFRPEAVVFSLSQFTPREEIDAPSERIVAELRALTAAVICSEEAGISHFTYLSSAGTVYGDTPVAAVEDAAPAPVSLYGRMKVICETVVTGSFARLSIPCAVLRIANPYGPGQNPAGRQGVVAIFFGRMVRGEPVEIFGASSKDYVFIDDVAEAILACVDHGANGVFNIGSGESTRLDDLVDAMSSLAGGGGPLVRQAALSQDVQSVALDISRAGRAFAWRPRTPLATGLRTTLAWIRNLPRDLA